MSDTRVLPKNAPRSTSIPRTQVNIAKPTIGGQGIGQHVAASPGASRAAHDHVRRAQQPPQQGAPQRPGLQPAAGQPQGARVPPRARVFPILSLEQLMVTCHLLDKAKGEIAASEPEARSQDAFTLDLVTRTLAQLEPLLDTATPERPTPIDVAAATEQKAQ